MIESIIFYGIFIAANVTAVISTWGWLKSEKKNEDLDRAKDMYQKVAYSQRGELLTLRAEISFLRNQLEEKDEKAN
jgi:hypothetical protein